MPKQRQTPVVLSPQQHAASSRKRGENLRQIAASLGDPAARAVLIRRAEIWEGRADEIERGLQMRQQSV